MTQSSAPQEGDDLAWLDEIEARAEKATAGPWTAHGKSIWDHCEVAFIKDENGSPVGHAALYGNDPAENANFIANARTDIPKLISALRQALRSRHNGDDARVITAAQVVRSEDEK